VLWSSLKDDTTPPPNPRGPLFSGGNSRNEDSEDSDGEDGGYEHSNTWGRLPAPACDALDPCVASHAPPTLSKLLDQAKCKWVAAVEHKEDALPRELRCEAQSNSPVTGEFVGAQQVVAVKHQRLDTILHPQQQSQEQQQQEADAEV